MTSIPCSAAFDAPDGNTTTAKRNVTTTPTQSLLMINGKWTLDRARAFAKRLSRDYSGDEIRVRRAYALAYGRIPQDDEVASAVAFLERQRELAGSAKDADQTALTDFCHAILNANEFLYVD